MSEARIAKAVERSIAEQHKQVIAVEDYLRSIGVEKEIHIGETGWASLTMKSLVLRELRQPMSIPQRFSMMRL